MRIAYLATSRLPSVEANSVHVMRMSGALARGGHDVVLVGRPGDDALGDAHDYFGTTGFAVRVAEAPPVRVVRPWIRAARVRAMLPAVDLAYGRDPHSLLLVAGQGVPIGYEVHEVPDGRRRRLERRLLRSTALRGAVFITAALERAYVEAIPESVGIPRLVAPDGADLAPPRPERRSSRQGRPVVGYAGGLYEGRGIELIVGLAARMPHVAFRVIGGSGPVLERHRRAAVDLPNLSFVGQVPASSVGRELDHFDIALAPYQVGLRTARGGDTSAWMSPLKVFEYMARSLAIVASDLPVLREVLRPGENALLVEPGDADAWLSAVQRLLDEPDLRARLGATARADLEREFSWDVRADRILRFLAV